MKNALWARFLLPLVLAISAPALADDISNGSYSTTDSLNNSAPPAGWPSGMYPSEVEPTARANMGATARWWERANPTLTTTGSAGAYALTTSNVLYPTAYKQGEVYCAKANFTSVGSDTLAVNSLAALPLYQPSGTGPTAVVAGQIHSGAMFCAAYDAALNSGAGGFQLLTGGAASLDTIGSTQGDILYRGSSAWSVLGPGTAGQFLQTDGSAANPSWSSPPAAAQFGINLNAVMSVTTASATATFTADMITVTTSLSGGTPYSLGSFSHSINLGTTGAGGMDTGSAPASGFVALYAIYNPTTQTSAILACNVTTSTGSVYSGSNMPSGYTASGLIGIWPTNGSSQFIPGYISGRSFWKIPGTPILSGGTSSTYASVNLATDVPPAAKGYSAELNGPSTAQLFADVAASSAGMAEKQFYVYWTGSGIASATLSHLPIITTQTIYYHTGGVALTIITTGYDF